MGESHLSNLSMHEAPISGTFLYWVFWTLGNTPVIASVVLKSSLTKYLEGIPENLAAAFRPASAK